MARKKKTISTLYYVFHYVAVVARYIEATLRSIGSADEHFLTLFYDLIVAFFPSSSIFLSHLSSFFTCTLHMQPF